MKAIINNQTILLLICLFLMACNKEKNQEVSTDKPSVKQTKEVVTNDLNIVSNVIDIQLHIAMLKDTEPIKPKELKAWLPEHPGAFIGTKFSLGKQGLTGVSTVSATYSNVLKGKVKQTLSIDVMDCTGETGNIMTSSMLMAKKVVYEKEDEREYLKQVDKNGIHATQTFKKRSNSTILQFVYNERYSVKIKSTNILPEDTWDYLNHFDCVQLPST